MRHRASCLLLAVLTSLAIPAGARSAEPVELIETGTFHGDEIAARTGESWNAFFVTEGSTGFLSVEIAVTRVYDPIVDEDEGTKTGKLVAVPGMKAPIFLVRGLRQPLSRGAATTVHATSLTLASSTDVSFDLGDERYRLWVEAAGSDMTDAKLLLSTSGTRQTLYALTGSPNDASWRLVWAGDLDGDGLLDLYVDASDHYNVSEKRLFLSSQARRGDLVGQVATFRTTGC